VLASLPVFAEIARTFNIDPADIRKQDHAEHEAQTAGNPADVDRILPWRANTV